MKIARTMKNAVLVFVIEHFIMIEHHLNVVSVKSISKDRFF